MRGSSLVWLLLAVSSSVRPASPAEADVSVITAADIASEKPADLLEMLKRRVGLDETNSVITMRGVRGIAVFVDGFASSSAELGSIKPEQVERIEILRGAASARFGAEAMGGAIAVTTRGVAARLSLVQGYDSRRGRFSRIVGGRSAAGFDWSLLAEDRTENGYRTVPVSPFPYQITVDAERSTTRLLDGKLGWRSPALDWAVELKRADDGSFLGRPFWAFGWRTDNIRARLAWRLAPALTLETAIGEERYDMSGSRDRGTGTDAWGLSPQRWLASSYRQREGSAALVWRAADWSLRFGTNLVDLAEDYATADYGSRQLLSAAESSIRKQALFAAAELPLAAGRLELGLRRDLQRYLSSRMETAGPPAVATSGGGVVKSATSPKLAFAWPLGRHRLRAGVGTGFSPPAASQLYNGYAGSGAVTLANPGLQPERSTTADLSLARGDDWNVTLFATRWRDKIATRILDYGTPMVQQPQNVGEVRAGGFELQGRWPLVPGWSATANYTQTRTRIVRDLADPALVGNELPDMPRHKANLTLAYEDAAFSARAKLRLVGRAYTDEANTGTDAQGYRWRKPGYAVLDLAATWRRPDWEFTLALDNAFDQDYLTGFFWRGQPRLLRGELTLHL